VSKPVNQYRVGELIGDRTIVEIGRVPVKRETRIGHEFRVVLRCVCGELSSRMKLEHARRQPICRPCAVKRRRAADAARKAAIATLPPFSRTLNPEQRERSANAFEWMARQPLSVRSWWVLPCL
jgi:hypothetical protein